MDIYNPTHDPSGEKAMYRAFENYEIGLNEAIAGNDYEALDNYRSAELLHIHAACKGQLASFLGLGYIYAYNRCDGMWDESPVDPYGSGVELFSPDMTREDRAFYCFSKLAENDNPEGMYKLGDMYRQGMGCEIDFDKAFENYAAAEEFCEFAEKVGHPAPNYLWGSVAMRLGMCYEMGEGCEQNFRKALKYFEEAEVGLNTAVTSGFSTYSGNLSRARKAIQRIKQELDGTY